MYVGTTASIKGLRATFEVLVGCRQGGQESPVLFNYYFDFVLNIAALEIDKAFPKGWGLQFEYNIPSACSNREQWSIHKLYGTEIIHWILYADDIVLFSKTIEEAETVLNILHSTCKRFGLNISFKKTKTQVFNDDILAAIPSLLKIEDNNIENVREFTYLGHVFSNQSANPTIEQRKARANAKFHQLKEVLGDTKVNRHTRWKLLEACVVPRLLYGLQAAYPKEDQLKKLEACWYQILRSMVRGGWRRVSDDPENPDYRFIHTNKDLENILNAKSIREIARSRNLKYLGHVCRQENNAITKRMMFAEKKDVWGKIAKDIGIDRNQLLKTTQNRSAFRDFCEKL